MFFRSESSRSNIVVGLAAALGALLLGAACSSSSSGPATASCSHPGQATPGPADDHCATAAPDGGALVNTVNLACNAPASGDDGGGDDGGGASACAYAATEYGQESDDDDCKYHVVWTSTPLCEQPGSVTFKVVLTRKSDGTPVTGAGTVPEVFTTTPGDQDAATYCDDNSMHIAPTATDFTEGPAGTYSGTVGFDRPGAWTLRFHFFETCTDAPTAPHGHAAFHLTLP